MGFCIPVRGGTATFNRVPTGKIAGVLNKSIGNLKSIVTFAVRSLAQVVE